jgi:hypothetical protein
MQKHSEFTKCIKRREISSELTFEMMGHFVRQMVCLMKT